MINELLGIKYPIIQGAMANISNGLFASVVSNAGGLGIIAGGGMDIDSLKKEIRVCKSNTNKPFGVNLVVLHPHIDELAQLVIEENVPVVTTGAGNPSKYIEKWKKAGLIVMPVVPNLTLAKRMESYGADAIVAEGNESGGHIGPMTTMTVLGEICNNINIPVVSAGGICSGRQMVATEIMGASGFQMGTIFLATDECPIHENYKNAILKASSNNITVTGYSISTPVRLLKNEMSRNYLKLEHSGADKMELERYTLGSLRRAVQDGDTTHGSVMAGLVVGQVKEQKSVNQLLMDLMDDYYNEWEKVCEKSKTKHR
ncbi:MAG: nitronate monooxygenase [Peptostreptococcaceae bacterium]|nr:nitronate monooxygenase [Peptostreptococcaceae bacterium]